MIAPNCEEAQEPNHFLFFFFCFSFSFNDLPLNEEFLSAFCIDIECNCNERKNRRHYCMTIRREFTIKTHKKVILSAFCTAKKEEEAKNALRKYTIILRIDKKKRKEPKR